MLDREIIPLAGASKGSTPVATKVVGQMSDKSL